ncbi:DUF2207 domain-containing protein [Siminovitchia sediminis]|uniref:DUF2207 domain-containing protein n=1 Tax=Siminovitchia sediminis TaxID=1274353 RepID=A0ABW4KL80_9BACI
MILVWRKVTLFTVVFLFFLPAIALAVDFSISDVKIDAYLLENGEVHVIEQFTYEFDGEFNGISREISPKKGAEISSFLAKEGGKDLKTEKDGDMYKVYRSGKDETIQVELQYLIEDGMEKYVDVAQFYWPFFDDRNEADYGRLTIAVHPPRPTDDAIALGYDTAFDKEHITEGGTAVFSVGNVKAGQNGDIRVVFDASLFPGLPFTDTKEMKQEIIDEKMMMKEKAAAFAKGQKTAASAGFWSLLGFAVLFIGICIYDFRRRIQLKQNVVKEVFASEVAIPKQEMSMPATISFTTPDRKFSIPAALMDLVRQGYVKQTGEGRFMLGYRMAREDHEQQLISLLFDQMGSNHSFSVDDLERFMKKEENHRIYTEETTKWKMAVQKEIKQQELFRKRIKIRWMTAAASIIPFFCIIIFAGYELYLWMTLSIFLFLLSLLFSIFYKPLSEKGIRMKEEWKRLNDEFDQMKNEQWNRYSQDDRMRAMIYSLGIHGANLKQFEIWEQKVPAASASDMAYFPIFWPALSNSFAAADEQASQSFTSQSGSPSSGGGVGGGGGGSGAF